VIFGVWAKSDKPEPVNFLSPGQLSFASVRLVKFVALQIARKISSLTHFPIKLISSTCWIDVMLSLNFEMEFKYSKASTSEKQQSDFACPGKETKSVAAASKAN
jgi:hypothetical protein